MRAPRNSPRGPPRFIGLKRNYPRSTFRDPTEPPARSRGARCAFATTTDVISFLKESVRFDSPLVIVCMLAAVAFWWWRRPASRAPWRLLIAFLAVFYLVATPIGAGVLVAGL